MNKEEVMKAIEVILEKSEEQATMLRNMLKILYKAIDNFTDSHVSKVEYKHVTDFLQTHLIKEDFDYYMGLEEDELESL